ncbi:MAG: type II toxin-antitoxin system PemK/MazF family toxin [Thermodesulfobacteriota bacterium]
MNIRRGQCYLAALDPAAGSEIAKTRPVLAISNNLNNKYSGTVTILPITSKRTDRIYPFEVFLPGGTANLPKDSKIKADQIRTLDKNRLIKYLGEVENVLMQQINKAAKIHLSLF